MLSRFHTIPACHGRTDKQTDGQTVRIGISISRVSSRMLTRDKNHCFSTPATVTQSSYMQICRYANLSVTNDAMYADACRQTARSDGYRRTAERNHETNSTIQGIFDIRQFIYSSRHRKAHNHVKAYAYMRAWNQGSEVN